MELEKKKELLLNHLNVYKSIGNRLAQLHKNNEAINYYNLAMEAVEGGDKDNKGLAVQQQETKGDNAGEVETLVARSHAESLLPDHRAARADAQLAVKKAPQRPCVLQNDASTLFDMDRFEQALVQYHSGLRVRQKPDYFQNGVLVATETVEDCVGRHAGDLLDNSNLGRTVLRLWLYAKNFHPPPPSYAPGFAIREQKRRENAEKFFGERYLQKLSHDKQFLLSCLGNGQLYSGDIDSYTNLQSVLSDAVANINRRQKTLMRLRPMYTWKVKESMLRMSSTLQAKVETERRKQQLDAAKLAFQLAMTASQAQRDMDTSLCLRTAYRVIEYIRNKRRRHIGDKGVYLHRMYNIIGDMFLNMKKRIANWTDEENDVRILYMLGLKVVNENAEEHLRTTFLPYIHDPRKLLDDSEKNMASAVTALEKSFLYHEMSRCCGQLEKYELARTMGRRCAQEARPVRSTVWVVNGMFMVARFESLQRNYVDAKNTIHEALELAKKLDRPDIISFLERTLRLLDFAGMLYVERTTVLEKREKDMLEGMPTESMRMEMMLLFMRMSNVPPSRRMMLVPGYAPATKKKAADNRRKEREASMRSSVNSMASASRKPTLLQGGKDQMRTLNMNRIKQAYLKEQDHNE